MLLNKLRRFCFTFSYYWFLITRTYLMSIEGNEPLTIWTVALLANHYTNIIYW